MLLRRAAGGALHEDGENLPVQQRLDHARPLRVISTASAAARSRSGSKT